MMKIFVIITFLLFGNGALAMHPALEGNYQDQDSFMLGSVEFLS